VPGGAERAEHLLTGLKHVPEGACLACIEVRRASSRRGRAKRELMGIVVTREGGPRTGVFNCSA
jgi:hypothetical protein